MDAEKTTKPPVIPPRPFIPVKPTLARIVHYLENNHIFAAMVVHVDKDSPMHINLVFWNEHGEQLFRRAVPFLNEATKHKDPALIRAWVWPKVPMPNLEQVRAMGEQFRKQMEGVSKQKQESKWQMFSAWFTKLFGW